MKLKTIFVYKIKQIQLQRRGYKKKNAVKRKVKKKRTKKRKRAEKEYFLFEIT